MRSIMFVLLLAGCTNAAVVFDGTYYAKSRYDYQQTQLAYKAGRMTIFELSDSEVVMKEFGNEGEFLYTLTFPVRYVSLNRYSKVYHIGKHDKLVYDISHGAIYIKRWSLGEDGRLHQGIWSKFPHVKTKRL